MMKLKNQTDQTPSSRPPVPSFEDDHWITLRRRECERVLRFCWPYLSEQTRKNLRSIGIEPGNERDLGLNQSPDQNP